MARPEAIDVDTIILTCLEPDIVLDSVKIVIEEHKDESYSYMLAEYYVENTSWRVLRIIMGTTKVSNKWWGIDK